MKVGALPSITPVVFTLFLLVSCLLATIGTACAEPERVTVGAYINDVQDIDLHSHSYQMDMYVWFRWHDPQFDPSRTAEFMNAFDPEEQVRTNLYDEPQKMPDGSLYAIIRVQGKFSSKFEMQLYPFDHQTLQAAMEDGIYDADTLVYVADDQGREPLVLNPQTDLPGFHIGKAFLDITAKPYPTDFGDIREDQASSPYSRATFTVPVTRPWFSTGIKIFLPILLVLCCTVLVFFIHPSYIEGRLGVAITALLTLVALQLTTMSSLPDTIYLLMIDKIYLLSYLFIIATLTQVVRTSALVHNNSYDKIASSNRRTLALLCVLFTAGIVVIFVAALF